MHTLKGFNKSKISVGFSWFLGVSVLVLTGAVYRVAASGLNLVLGKPIVLPMALSKFPTKLGNWEGEDVSIPEYIQRVTGNDDFLYRVFANKATGQWASVYVAYSGRPRTMLGHRPEVCYVAEGWIYEDSKEIIFLSAEQKEIPCVIGRFHKPGFDRQERVVLSFYVLNGQVISSEESFSGLSWRTPNIAGDPARYVAQVQISSMLENSVLAAAKDMTDRIIDFLPDENGKVKIIKDYK